MIRIYGGSDDLVEIEGDYNEELNVEMNKWMPITIGDEKGGLLVHVGYGLLSRNGVWEICVEQIDEDVPIPWLVTIGVAPQGYSTLLTVNCPRGTPIQWGTE